MVTAGSTQQLLIRSNTTGASAGFQITASAGPISEFSKRMGASYADTMRNQVGQLRASGMKGDEISKMYAGRLSPELEKELGQGLERLAPGDGASLRAATRRDPRALQYFRLDAGQELLFPAGSMTGSEKDFLERPKFTQPEIQRANLADVILRLKAFGLGDILAQGLDLSAQFLDRLRLGLEPLGIA